MSFVISGMKSHVFKEMKDIEAYTQEEHNTIKYVPVLDYYTTSVVKTRTN